MNKTKRNLHKHNSTNRTRSYSKPCCEATFHGLHKWYQSKFEKLGWIILAKEHGIEDKVNTYINSLKRLDTAIIRRLDHIKDPDKKHDLLVMKNNIEILIKHVEKDFTIQK